MSESAQSNISKVHKFVPEDPDADLSGKEVSLYITSKTPKDDGFEFEGYMCNTTETRSIQDGYITPSFIEFSTNYKGYVRHGVPVSVQFKGSFFTESLLYHVAYQEPTLWLTKTFDLKNQKIIFEPFLRPPPSPFFLYKYDIFGLIAQHNPGKKLSELTSLIAEQWNNLDEEKRRFYKQKHEEALKKYQEYWKDPARKVSNKRAISNKQRRKKKEENLKTSGSKKAKVSPKDCCLTHIFGAITYHAGMWTMSHGNKVYEERVNYQNHWRYDTSWTNALNYVRKEYRKLTKESEKLRQPDEDLYLDYECKNDARLDFQATIVVLEDGKANAISQAKLKLELNKQVQSVSTTKKYWIISILRESDFDAQTIKEVLSFLPKYIPKSSLLQGEGADHDDYNIESDDNEDDNDE